jgi:pyrroloquinoline quinone (PQQ) biosynthesis protein C
MEHFRSPFSPADLSSASAIVNRAFFSDLLLRTRSHRFYSHPFLVRARADVPRDAASAILTSFYKVVAPFTGLLCSLGGRAPDLRCRFALMDNIYEEMGCGELEAAHPSLYLAMLRSIGVSAEAAERAPALPSVRRINEHLEEVITRGSFATACAVLASAEAAIPPSFPVLASMARDAFPRVDMAFFDRHGPRDDGHSDDAATLFSVSADIDELAGIEAEVMRDLDHRAELFDEWMALIASAAASRAEPRLSSGRSRPPSIRPTARSSAPPPG